MNIKKYAAITLVLTTAVGFGMAVPAFADTGKTNPGMMHGLDHAWQNAGVMAHMSVFGTVSAVTGNTITVINKRLMPGNATTTYIVDATNARITKAGTTSTISVISVGDIVVVQGTINGTNVTATVVIDGMPIKVKDLDKKDDKKDEASTTPVIVGNGQPIIAGTISAISSSTVTVTNKSNVTYTVDATNAKIVQGKNLVTISALKVGDAVVVQGAVNGNSVSAYSIIEGKTPKNEEGSQGLGHIFGGIGNFFKRLFGF